MNNSQDTACTITQQVSVLISAQPELARDAKEIKAIILTFKELTV